MSSSNSRLPGSPPLSSFLGKEGAVDGAEARETPESVQGGRLVGDGKVVSSGGTRTISSGQTVGDLTVQGGGTVFVEKGGEADNVTATGSMVSASSSWGKHHDAFAVWGMAIAGTHGCLDSHLSSGGVINHLIASHYGAGLAVGGGQILGGEALDSGAIVAGDGGTVAGATAGANGAIMAGGISGGAGGMSGVHIMSGGAGVVGAGLSSEKNGRTFTLNGHGISHDAVVDAGGLLDVLNNGTAFGGAIMGAGVVESGGTLDGALFSGAPKPNAQASMNGYNGWINAGGVAQNNRVEGGAVLGINGGTGSGNTALSGGLIKVGYGQAHILRNGSTTNQHSMVVTGSMERGVATSTLVSSGGSQLVDGGVESGATILASGAQSIDQGGTGFGDIVSGGSRGGGRDIIGSGGALSGGTATGSGATILASVGGLVDGGTAMDHGLVSIGKGGSGDDLSAQDAGSVYVGSGGMAGAVSVNGGGTGSFAGDQANVRVVSVADGGTALNPFLRSGQTLIVDSGGYASGAIIGPGMDSGFAGDMMNVISDVSGYGSVAAGGTLSGASIAGGFDDGSGAHVTEMGGLLRIEAGATVRNLSVGYYGQIEIMGVNGNGAQVSYVSNVSGPAGGTLLLTSDSVSMWSAVLTGDYNSSAWQIWYDTDNSGTAVIVYDTCFLAGTLIDTPDGPRPVEEIQKGDLINALAEGKITPVTALGLRRGRGKVNPRLPEDLAGWPVCILKDAFGAGVPARDLRVTAEHCFFFEGRFIPVRMLVNGKSIYYDTSLPEFAFYHLETGPHAVIFAEGALTESWLNTDVHRKAVPGADGITRLEVSRARSWAADAAAPLEVSAGFAGPLWKRLDSRADFLGLADRRPPLTLESDPDLRLLLADGRELRPARRRGRLYLFDLPVRAQPKALLSRIFRPSESVGPWVDDRRQLGVLVGRISVFGPDGLPCEITAHLGRPDAPGWDVAENSPCRWTRGAAALPPLPDPEITRQPAAMVVEILAGGPYRTAASNASEAPLLRAVGQTGRR